MDRGCARCSVHYSMCSYVFYGHGWIGVVPGVVCVIPCVAVFYGHGWIGVVPGVVCVIQCVAMCFMDTDG